MYYCMLAILLNVRIAWNYYFTGNPTYIKQNEYTSRQTPSSTSVYISNCLFKSIISESDGGALLCTSVTYLLIKSISFFSCKTRSQIGGAICFSNTNNGQHVLCELCGYDCYSTSTSYTSGQFAYIEVSNAASSKNYVNYSSISGCVNENLY